MASSFNFAAMAICGKGLYDTLTLPLPEHLVKGGQLQFLSNLSVLVTVVYFLIEGIYSAAKGQGPKGAESTPVPSPRPKALDLFHHFCFTLEFTVTVTYWSFWYYVPEWLNSGSFEPDLVLDLEIHLIPFILLLVNRGYYYRVHRGVICGMVAVFLSGYWLYIEGIYVGEQLRSYPFISNSSVWERLGFFAWFIGISFVSIFIQNSTI